MAGGGGGGVVNVGGGGGGGGAGSMLRAGVVGSGAEGAVERARIHPRTARAENRRVCLLSALRAHIQKAPYKPDLLWKTLRTLKRPGRPGQKTLSTTETTSSTRGRGEPRAGAAGALPRRGTTGGSMDCFSSPVASTDSTSSLP